jgi:PST family polysaccharide transporter
MLPLGEPFAAVIFGDQWREAGYAAMAMFAYVGGRSLINLAGEAFKAAEQPNLLPRMYLLSAVLGIASIVALLPLGLVGVSAAISISSIGVTAYAIRAASGVLEVPATRIVSEIVPAVAASVVMAGALTPLEHLVVDAANRETAVGLLLLASETLAAAGIYLGALAVVAPPLARELVELARKAPSRLTARGGGAAATLEPDVPPTPTPVN